MSFMQKSIVKKYLELHQFPTLKSIAEDTGLHLTRVHRIIHGHEMKLFEYEIFQAAIMRKLEKKENPSSSLMQENPSLTQLIHQCEKNLPQQELKEMLSLMERKLRYYHFRPTPQLPGVVNA